MPRVAAGLVLLALAGPAPAQGLTPIEAAERMKLPPGFTARCVASEPRIRQPVSISFDTRGRLWVLQYLQYPNYAGLKPVKQDQYLRTVWDKVPEPPPKGPKGADRLTILFDPDEHGVFRQSKDFVTGLNIASGFCLGNGGVYVVQPPYLLFYPDKDEDDVPDGDPEVLLSGFGMDDTHSLANSLQWGPDGWLYGAAGSTSTCKIADPADPKAPPVEFQQGISRFHPKTNRFELFSEGGGNTYGLDFDRHGQAIAGTNWGGFAMLHQMQGAYYVKGFAKHGPLHNPHAYGYFEHVPYTGFKGGHVTCGGIVYQADTYPKEYRDRYIAANLLSNAVYWHELEPAGSSFTARHGGELIEANDPWFRPVDCLQGPDGCVYVVDFHDKRAAHLDPIDNWDKTNGRIFRVEYKGGPKYETFDVRKKTTLELLELLKHPNVWWRRTARELLGARQDKTAHETLKSWAKGKAGDLALEALWALYVSGGTDEEFLASLFDHPNEYVRAWAVRLVTDHHPGNAKAGEWWKKLNPNEASPVVLAQVACSARRVPVAAVPDLITYLIDNPACAADPQLPLLVWWAIETEMTHTKGWAAAQRLTGPKWSDSVFRTDIVEKISRRWAAGDIKDGDHVFAAVFGNPSGFDCTPLVKGIAKGLDARGAKPLPGGVLDAMRRTWAARQDDPLMAEVMARTGDETALRHLRDTALNVRLADARRAKAVETLARARDPKLRELILDQLPWAKAEPLLVAYVSALETFDQPDTPAAVLKHYPSWPAAVKRRAVQLLVVRPAWALELFRELDAGRFLKADIGLDHARAAVALGDQEVMRLVEKHFGKVGPATPGEKQARITWLNTALGREKNADPARGKVLFTKHCAACHQLHGEGGKVGPDLTTADRKNRGYMLAHTVDPSGYIRPEYVVQNVLTTDDRRLSGLATDAGDSITLVTVVNDQPVKTVVPKKDIADISPSAVSLMPEKLLDTLTDAQVADLFAYIAADAPQKKDTPKLKISLVSGSFEYKSDASLAAFKKYVETNFPVECTLVAAKAEKDTALAGVEALAACDVAVFFTRRLRIEGESLNAVKAYIKSGKPVVGIRTASHGFQNWLEMDREVFGGNYKGHFGKEIVCEVKVAESAKDHPVLKGVSAFKSNGSLYKNPGVAGDVTVLLTGTIPGQSEPVAWVREKDGRRVFYTSLGHPDDFTDENFLRLLVNGLAWATRTDLTKK
jgi:putative membrane-bound dehydrogenase-like protein